jgi:hypothetical protein
MTSAGTITRALSNDQLWGEPPRHAGRSGARHGTVRESGARATALGAEANHGGVK